MRVTAVGTCTCINKYLVFKNVIRRLNLMYFPYITLLVAFQNLQRGYNMPFACISRVQRMKLLYSFLLYKINVPKVCV